MARHLKCRTFSKGRFNTLGSPCRCWILSYQIPRPSCVWPISCHIQTTKTRNQEFARAWSIVLNDEKPDTMARQAPLQPLLVYSHVVVRRQCIPIWTQHSGPSQSRHICHHHGHDPSPLKPCRIFNIFTKLLSNSMIYPSNSNCHTNRLQQRINLLTFCTNNRAHYFLGKVFPWTSTAIVPQLDKSVDNLWAHILLFPQDYTQNSTAQHYPWPLRQYRLGICEGGSVALDVYCFLISFTQRTSLHSQTQLLTQST